MDTCHPEEHGEEVEIHIPTERRQEDGKEGGREEGHDGAGEILGGTCAGRGDGAAAPEDQGDGGVE